MQIKIKFNIGDEVWFFVGTEPTKCEITDIDSKEYPILYRLPGYGWYDSKNLHRSKQELLQSLA